MKRRNFLKMLVTVPAVTAVPTPEPSFPPPVPKATPERLEAVRRAYENTYPASQTAVFWSAERPQFVLMTKEETAQWHAALRAETFQHRVMDWVRHRDQRLGVVYREVAR